MTTTTEIPASGKITLATFQAVCRERFGDNPADWAFVCPQCADVATGADFVAALEQHPRTNRDGNPVKASDVLSRECIGRTLGALGPRGTYDGRGCDWAAYGLISGPLLVEMPDGTFAGAFRPADAPAESVSEESQ